MRFSNEERFFAKVNKTDTCWLWTATVGSRGYGQFRFVIRHPGVPNVYKIQSAHKYSYELVNGTVPHGMILRHADICRRSRLCVNPAHLTPGTHQENMDDMARMNRVGREYREEESVRTKAQVRAIKLRNTEDGGEDWEEESNRIKAQVRAIKLRNTEVGGVTLPTNFWNDVIPPPPKENHETDVQPSHDD